MKVKVCGITRLEDALAAQAAGADMVGFVFAESPRRVEPGIASEIAAAVSCQKVGVFVDEPADIVNRIAVDCMLDFAQLHGDETQAECDAIEIPVIKAVRVVDSHALARAAEFCVARLLFDASVPGMAGGTGRTIDWSLLVRYNGPYILAGGLGPGNVAEAVSRLSPWGVDASSRLESEPGVKDHARVAAFIRAAKGLSDGT